MSNKPITKSHPFAFFGLVYAMSAPFWMLGAFLKSSWLPDNIPLSDIGATLSPALAACFLIYKEDGLRGLKTFLGRIFDYRRTSSRSWFFTALLLLPVLYLATYAVMRISGYPLAVDGQLSTGLLGALLMFLIAATVEELGYSAYATDALQTRYSALTTALLIGVPWAFWHLPSMLQMGQSWTLVAWGLGATVAFRVITVWLYNNNHFSLFVVILAHALGTTARSAFPGGRSAYELGDGAVSYAIIIVFALIIVVLWRPATLTNFLGHKRR